MEVRRKGQCLMLGQRWHYNLVDSKTKKDQSKMQNYKADLVFLFETHTMAFEHNTLFKEWTFQINSSKILLEHQGESNASRMSKCGGQQLLQNLRDILDDVECTWVIIGDFKSIMTMEEAKGRSSSLSTRDMIQFNKCKVGVIISRIFKILYDGGTRKKNAFYSICLTRLPLEEPSMIVLIIRDQKQIWKDYEDILAQEELMWFQKSR
ncbi:hypothetical protein CR513_61465, partial [Mucuna pruriens]